MTPDEAKHKGLALARQLWAFEPDEELPAGFCSFVFAQKGLVLKVVWRGEEAESGLHAALALSGGLGPKILDHHPSGLLLMERVFPGAPFSEPPYWGVDDLALFVRLHQALPPLGPENLLPLQDWFEERTPLVSHLLETSPPPRFLHGDLHHENILRSGDSWMLIDPKGVWGDPSFECCAILRNPVHRFPYIPDLASWLRKRIHRLSTLMHLPEDRIYGWALADRLSEPSEPGGWWKGHEKALVELAPLWPGMARLGGVLV